MTRDELQTSSRSTPAPTVPNCRPCWQGSWPRWRDCRVRSRLNRAPRSATGLRPLPGHQRRHRRVRRRPLPAQPEQSRLNRLVGGGGGELLSRKVDTVGHQRNAQAGLRRGEGSPTLLKGWKSTAQCSKCSNWPSTYTTDFLGLCRSAALAALDHTHAEAGEMRATWSCPQNRPTLMRTQRFSPHHLLGHLLHSSAHGVPRHG